MRRSHVKKITVVILLVGVVALAAGGVIGAVVDQAPVKTSTTTSTLAPTTTLPPIGNLGDVGKELGALVEAGRKVDYTAVYRVDDPGLPEGLTQTVEIWRKGALFRSDIVERSGSGTRRQSSTSGGAVSRSCETVDGKQTCQTVMAVPSDLPAVFIRAVVQAPTPPELTVRDDDVAGYVARCFEAKELKDELCLAGDGTMLRVVLQGEKGAATVELTSISADVPASAFDDAG